jgi:hypothetical protein
MLKQIRHRAVVTVASQTHAEVSSHYLQSSNSCISVCNRCLEIQLELVSRVPTEVGVCNLHSETFRWPPPVPAGGYVVLYHPEAAIQLQPSFSRMSLHLELLIHHLAINMSEDLQITEEVPP